MLAHGSEITLPANVLAPVYLDVLADEWPVEQADVIYTANLLHISPPSIPTFVFRGAQRLNVSEVFIYGPFFVNGQPTSEGNIRFDEQLRRQNPQWGIRMLNDVQESAAANGFKLVDSIPMPANNLFLHFCRVD